MTIRVFNDKEVEVVKEAALTPAEWMVFNTYYSTSEPRGKLPPECVHLSKEEHEVRSHPHSSPKQYALFTWKDDVKKVPDLRAVWDWADGTAIDSKSDLVKKATMRYKVSVRLIAVSSGIGATVLISMIFLLPVTLIHPRWELFDPRTDFIVVGLITALLAGWNTAVWRFYALMKPVTRYPGDE